MIAHHNDPEPALTRNELLWVLALFCVLVVLAAVCEFFRSGHTVAGLAVAVREIVTR